MRIEFFLTWWPIAETNVREFEIVNEPKKSKPIKKFFDLIKSPIKKLNNPNVRIVTNIKKKKL